MLWWVLSGAGTGATDRKTVSTIHTDHISCSYFHFGELTWKSWALWFVIYSVWLRRRYAIAFPICGKLHNFLRLSARFSVSDGDLANGCLGTMVNV